jgi:uncharacterized protein YbaP (TraB family)
MNPLRAIALLAVLPGLACGLWAPEPEPLPKLELPAAEFRPDESDMPSMLDPFEQSGLWLAKSPIGSFYLFGATDLVPEGGYASFGPVVEAAYAESQEVVQEIDLQGAEPTRTIALMRRYGTLKAPATLQSRVAPETWALLEERFAESGRSAATVRSMQPWLVSFAIANRAPLARGRDALSDIADRVQQRAKRTRGAGSKPIVGLRTLESQFQMFAALPRTVQDSLLRSALGAPYSPEDFLWQSPSLMPALAATSEDRQLFYEHLVYRRNELMAERLFQLGIDGKLRFVEVGVLHLVGARGLPSLLAQRGFKVSRVQKAAARDEAARLPAPCPSTSAS